MLSKYFFPLLAIVSAVLALPPGTLPLTFAFPNGQMLLANEEYVADLVLQSNAATTFEPLLSGLYIARWSENDQYDPTYYYQLASGLFESQIPFEIPEAIFTPDTYILYVNATDGLDRFSEVFTLAYK